jgi:hypothetical protein
MYMTNTIAGTGTDMPALPCARPLYSMISGLPVPEKQVIINNNRRTLKTMMNEL